MIMSHVIASLGKMHSLVDEEHRMPVMAMAKSFNDQASAEAQLDADSRRISSAATWMTEIATPA